MQIKKILLIVLCLGVLLIPLSLGVVVYSWLYAKEETIEECQQRVEKEQVKARKELQNQYEKGGMMVSAYLHKDREIEDRYKFSCQP